MIDRPQKIVCVGLSYRDDAKEQGVEVPAKPLLFATWPNTEICSGTMPLKTRSTIPAAALKTRFAALGLC